MEGKETILKLFEDNGGGLTFTEIAFDANLPRNIVRETLESMEKSKQLLCKDQAMVKTYFLKS